MSHNKVVKTNTPNMIQLTPPLTGPEPGKRFTWNHCIGSSDAGVIAEHAKFYRSQFSILVVICSEPTTAQRL